MVSGVTKRIVVIKDIPSNIIEEAILILKMDAGNGVNIDAKDVVKGMKGKENDLLLKEAEMIISSYIKENKLTDFNRKKRGTYARLAGTGLPASLMINLGLLGSIALLIFIILKLI